MTTNVIDGALGVSSIPTTYTGPATLVGNARKMGDVSNYQWYNFTSNGNATQINCGFVPRKIKVVNTTDGITWEWQYGMPAANSIKTTLGGSLASVQDTSSQITIAIDYAPGNVGTVTLGATLNGTGKNICVELAG
jgi:hypothetical protein